MPVVMAKTVGLESGASNPDLVRAVGVPDGGVVVAGFLGSTITVTRLDASLNLLWSTQLTSSVVNPTDLAVDAMGRVVVSSVQTGIDLRLMLLSMEDGELERAMIIKGATSPGLVATPDGGLMLAAGAKLDADWQFEWFGEGRGEDVEITRDGGYLFGAANTLQLNSSGLTIVRTNAVGEVQWRAFLTPGPGRHGLIGVRELSDGSIIGAISQDSTRSDNMASGSPLIIGRFDADGGALDGRAVSFSAPDRDGYSVSLRFGGAISMASQGDISYFGFIANSGGFGSDVRAQVVSAHDASGEFLGSMFGSAPAVDGVGQRYTFSSSGRVTSFSSLKDADACIVPVASTSALFEAKTVFETREQLLPGLSKRELTAMTFDPAPMYAAAGQSATLVCPAPVDEPTM